MKNKTIGQRILFHLEQKNLTQQWLVDKLDVSKQRVSKIIKTSTNPSAEMLFRIAGALQIPVICLLTDNKLNNCKEEELLTIYRGLEEKEKGLTIEIAKLLKNFKE